MKTTGKVVKIITITPICHNLLFWWQITGTSNKANEAILLVLMSTIKP